MTSEFVLDYKELLNVTEMILQLDSKFTRVTRRSRSIRLCGLVGASIGWGTFSRVWNRDTSDWVQEDQPEP